MPRWSGRRPCGPAALLIPLVLGLPALGMKLGLPSGASYDSGTVQRQSYQAVSDAFGPGYNGPLMVVARSADGDRPLAPRRSPRLPPT